MERQEDMRMDITTRCIRLEVTNHNQIGCELGGFHQDPLGNHAEVLTYCTVKTVMIMWRIVVMFVRTLAMIVRLNAQMHSKGPS